MSESNRIFGLDLLRAIAIIHVVCQHGSTMIEGSFLEGFPYVVMIDGVDIFFALSGYLIGKILLREINKPTPFQTKELLQFWKRRWFRTLPNYYLILFANFIVVKSGIIVEYISAFNWKFFFFLQNFNKPFMGFFWESWTLSIEEWFYIFAPLLLLVILKFLKPKVAFLLVTIVMLVAPLLHRAFTYDPNIDMNQWSEIYRKLVINRMDSIAYGLLGAWMFFYFGEAWHKIRYPALIVSVAIMYYIFHTGTDITTFYAQVILFVLSSFSAMLLLPLGESIKEGRGIFKRVITHISVISYSMYLIHVALVAEVIRDNFAPSSPNDGVLKYCIYWAVVIFVSSLLYNFYEKPMMNLRDKKRVAEQPAEDKE